LQVAGFLAYPRPGALHEGGFQPRRPLAQSGGATLAGVLVVARAQASPGDQVSGSGEAGYVDADFGDDHLRGQATDAGDGPQLADRLTERGEIAVHLRVDLAECGIERIHLAQVQTQQEAVPVAHASGQRRPQLLGRGLDPPLDEREQRVGVTLDTVDQQWLIRFLEHRIGDRRIIHLIRKWLRPGVLEDGTVMGSDRGTGQGSVISPLLANIYLHYVLDLWANRW
jgi:hypothetical protein